jgi:hypothetical protein
MADLLRAQVELVLQDAHRLRVPREVAPTDHRIRTRKRLKSVLLIR